MRFTIPAIVLLTLGTGLHPAMAQSTPTLAFTRTSYAAGGEPRAVAAADFNADGTPDVALANLGLGGGTASGVAVFYNTGDGTLGAGTLIPTGAGAFELAVADLNRDGRLDLVVSNADANTVSVLLGSDAGLTNAFTWSTSRSPRGIVAGDFTRDGRLDLAVVGYDCNCVDIGRGHGDGTFTTVNTFPVDRNPEDIVTGDFNRDGTSDLLVANVTDGTATVLFGTGEGGFVVSRDDFAMRQPRGLHVADFDRNGRLDVAQVADGLFRLQLDVPVSSVYGARVGRDTRAVTALDANSDGWPDVAVANRGGGGIQVLVNITADQPVIGFGSAVGVSTGDGARALAAADMDGDGRDDLIVANQYAHTVAVMLNRTPRFPPTAVER